MFPGLTVLKRKHPVIVIERLSFQSLSIKTIFVQLSRHVGIMVNGKADSAFQSALDLLQRWRTLY